jgi:hypothetical protein
MKVPWMSREAIAGRAEALIQDFQTRAGYRVIPPIPVEEIMERSLQLTIRYLDLSEIFKDRQVLGATYIEPRLVCIHERLFDNGSEGRLVFTCAHEAGHWVLHRRYVESQGGKKERKDAIVCTTTNARESIEWQADYFASCLLMPERAVREAFQRVCAEEPIVIRHSKALTREGSPCPQPYLEQWPFIAAAMCEVGGFSNVSLQAMVIRLQDLGLIVNKTGLRMNWQALCPS